MAWDALGFGGEDSEAETKLRGLKRVRTMVQLIQGYASLRSQEFCQHTRGQGKPHDPQETSSTLLDLGIFYAQDVQAIKDRARLVRDGFPANAPSSEPELVYTVPV